jgi:hypothetical protein
MSNYIRTLVSGGKSRYKDKELNVELGPLDAGLRV